MQVAQYGGHRMSNAFFGTSVLDLPVDASFISRGFYITYDTKTYRPAPNNQNFVDPKGDPKPNSATGQQDTKVVLQAMQRLMRNVKEPEPFAAFSQSRPVR